MLVSVSVPITKSIYFLKANIAADVQGIDIKGTVTLGCWGYCIGDNCTPSTLGYNLGALLQSPSQGETASEELTQPSLSYRHPQTLWREWQHRRRLKRRPEMGASDTLLVPGPHVKPRVTRDKLTHSLPSRSPTS